MVINLQSTIIEFYPFIEFNGIASVSVQVWHKNTKIMVSGTSNVLIEGTRVTLDLPSLTNIADVAHNLDNCLIRVYYQDAIMWEYLATWSDESTNINKTFKNWDTTSNISPEWITL
jgi:hypothetical protein